jgi:hypothetical protein
MPLTTQPIHLDAVPAFGLGVIPPSVSDTVSFPPQPQDVSGPLQQMLKEAADSSHCTAATNPALSCNVLALTITKTTPIAAHDTLFVAPDSASLFAPPGTTPYTSTAGGILLPVALAAADTAVGDTINISQASMSMLRTAGQTGQPLWIQFRGQVSNPSASPITLTSADSIGIAVAVTMSVAISHR